MLNEIFRLFGSIVIDNESAKKSIDSTVKHAETQQKKLQQKLENFGKATIKFGTAFATTAAAVGGALINVANNTREYRQQMGQLTTAFQTNGLSAGQAKSTYEDLYAVLGDTDRSVEAATNIAKLSDNTEELQSWVAICTGIYAKFGEGMPIETLTESARETAATGTLTGELSRALTEAGVSEEEFQKKLDACNNEQERADEIGRTLIGTYGSYAATYRENNKEVMEANRAHDNLNSAMAKLGEAAEPIATKLTNFATKLVESATPAVEGMASGIGSILENFEAFGAWIEENKTVIMSFLGPLLITFVIMKAPLLLLAAAIAFVASNWNTLSAGVAWCKEKLDEFFGVTIPQAWKDMCESIGTWWNDNVLTPINNAIAAVKEFLGIQPTTKGQARYKKDASQVNLKGAWSRQYFDSLLGDDGSHASGLDFVPRDDYRARLHYGEAVLTRSEANAWRRGQGGGIDYDRLAEAMAQRPLAFNIDSKAFAVMLAREMNRAIGNRNIQTMMAMGG